MTILSTDVDNHAHFSVWLCCLIFSDFSWPILRFFAAVSSPAGVSVCSFGLFVANVNILH